MNRPFLCSPPTLALLALLATVGCKSDDTRRLRNVLLVSIDTLRADHLGCYGADGNPTPGIDRLAARGTRFENAYTAVPVTTPSHATAFTGTYPPRHGVRSNGGYRLPEDRQTLAELFREQGWATAAFVGGFPLDRQFGLAQGTADGAAVEGRHTDP